MIKEIDFIKYRKFEKIKFDFSKNINVISGVNGTCKTSLLHIVSNSFQKVPLKSTKLTDKKCLSCISAINQKINPKIEALTKGDKDYNDPAHDVKGTLFSVLYNSSQKLEFRKHNSKESQNHRFAIKPKYPQGKKESLPETPVIYLGLFRLVAFGEFNDSVALKKITNSLPKAYQEELSKLYEECTWIKVHDYFPEEVEGIKNRASFKTDRKGIDSNTISAGEDNLLIILTALISLKYYYISLNDIDKIESNGSVLLIDEMDATLHPSLQKKLYNLIDGFSLNYNIQVFFTTHSLTLIDYALTQKNNKVHYITNNGSFVELLDSPSISAIKMYLKNISREMLFGAIKIPFFTEDSQARDFLEILLEFAGSEYPEFKKIKSHFYLVEGSFGSENLKTLFKDPYVNSNRTGGICILDGDQNEDFHNSVIILPGKASPEQMIFDYVEAALNNDRSSVWCSEEAKKNNYSMSFYNEHVKPDINQIQEKIENMKAEGNSTKGMLRDLNKNVYEKHKNYFKYLFWIWVQDSKNLVELEKFYDSLKTMLCKVASLHNIEAKELSTIFIKPVDSNSTMIRKF